jgi:hypothetical protein
MLTHHRRSVCLSLVSTDLPIWFTVETNATLYQKDQERFHLLLCEPSLEGREAKQTTADDNQKPSSNSRRILWLEISPYRAIMTMQESGKLSYRHLWEPGIFGISRYWLQNDLSTGHESLRLRNYTRSLKLEGRPLPQRLQLEYELWSEKVQLGCYILNLQIEQ